MQSELVLKETGAYRVHYSNGDDGYRDVTIGHYSSFATAERKSKKAGWYGGDAEVSSEDDIYTDGEFLYKVKKLGRYTDVEEEIQQALSASIRLKLSPEELEFIKNNQI